MGNEEIGEVVSLDTRVLKDTSAKLQKAAANHRKQIAHAVREGYRFRQWTKFLRSKRHEIKEIKDVAWKELDVKKTRQEIQGCAIKQNIAMGGVRSPACMTENERFPNTCPWGCGHLGSFEHCFWTCPRIQDIKPVTPKKPMTRRFGWFVKDQIREENRTMDWMVHVIQQIWEVRYDVKRSSERKASIVNAKIRSRLARIEMVVEDIKDTAVEVEDDGCDLGSLRGGRQSQTSTIGPSRWPTQSRRSSGRRSGTSSRRMRMTKGGGGEEPLGAGGKTVMNRPVAQRWKPVLQTGRWRKSGVTTSVMDRREDVGPFCGGAVNNRFVTDRWKCGITIAVVERWEDGGPFYGVAVTNSVCLTGAAKKEMTLKLENVGRTSASGMLFRSGKNNW